MEAKQRNKENLRAGGPRRRLRHSVIAKVSLSATAQIDVKETPRRRAARAKSLLVSRKKSAGLRSSQRDRSEKSEVRGTLDPLVEDVNLELMEGENGRNESKDDQEVKFDSWLQEVLGEEGETRESDSVAKIFVNSEKALR